MALRRHAKTPGHRYLHRDDPPTTLITPDSPLYMLYKSLVQSYLEYANSLWNPYQKQDIKALEKVQMNMASRINIYSQLSISTILIVDIYNNYIYQQLNTDIDNSNSIICLKTNWPNFVYKVTFYPCDAMLARVIAIATCLSVRLSVRLSVTSRYCIKTKKASVMISSLPGSPKTLVF